MMGNPRHLPALAQNVLRFTDTGNAPRRPYLRPPSFQLGGADLELDAHDGGQSRPFRSHLSVVHIRDPAFVVVIQIFLSS